MIYLRLVLCILSSMIFNAYSADVGLKALIQIKVFEGTSVMMYERNLSMVKNCNVGFIKNSNLIVGNCSVELTDIGRDKKSGVLQVNINGFDSGIANFQMTVLANGYIGGGQDGPYFTTNYRLPPKSVQDSVINLGFYSRTPEIAQDYFVRVSVFEFKPCDSVENCSI